MTAFFFAAALGFLKTSSGAASAREPDISRPKAVIVIMLDAARSDHFSCYGYGRRTTPSTDAIAARGALFTEAFSPGVDTVDAVSRVMSSRYRSRHYLSNVPEAPFDEEHAATVFYDFPPKTPLLPDFFSKEGFLTAAFSDHPFFRGRPPLRRGFSEFQGGLKNAAEVFGKAREWLGKNRGKKRFVYIHVLSPHEPYTAPMISEWSRGFDAESLRRIRENPEAALSISSGIEIVRALYDAQLRDVDGEIGRFDRWLRESGTLGETMIVVTADHGERLGENGRLRHGGFPDDAVLRVPLIISYPPLIEPGVRVDGFVSTVDLLPTLASAAGLTEPSEIDGADLLPAISARGSGRGFVLSDSYFRTPDYKWMAPRDPVSLLPEPVSPHPGRLFRLGDDPLEARNLSREEPGLLNELRGRFRSEITASLSRWDSLRSSGPASAPFFIPAGELLQEPVSPWRHFRYGRLVSLERMPERGESFAFLRETLPSGEYDAEAVVEFSKTEPVPSLRTRLGFRPVPSPDSWPIRFLEEDSRFVRFPLGMIRVEGENFSTELDLGCGGKSCLLHAILFSPAGLKRGGAVPSARDMDEAYRSLRDAGYLRRGP